MNAPRTLAVMVLALAPLVTAAGQETAKRYASLEDLNASYARQAVELDRKRVLDLAATAEALQGEEAEAAYRQLFRLAVVRDFYAEAEPAARAFLKSGPADPQDRALASFIGLIARANRGEYDQSLADLENYLKKAPIASDPSKRLDPAEVVAVGEAYLQRLFRGGRYDIARKVCELAMKNHPDASVRGHFQGRLARIEMIGKPAPEILGSDVDGKPIRLSDFKGKVILVDFWATWCPPCIAAFPELKAADVKYGPKGFEILGVNLDAQRQDVGTVAKAAPTVRKFLLATRAAWPNVLIGPGAKDDPATLYGVDEIPANFLIDRTGKITHIELAGPDLDRAIAEALK